MEVLLQANVPNLGHVGDLVKVKPGYARNFLFPKSLAVQANSGNKSELEHQKRLAEAKKQKILVAAQNLGEIISALSLTIQKPVGEDDKIFGSVTTAELATAFKAAGHDIEKRAISIIDDIKRVGVYKGSVKLHPEVTTQFNIWVIAQT